MSVPFIIYCSAMFGFVLFFIGMGTITFIRLKKRSKKHFQKCEENFAILRQFDKMLKEERDALLTIDEGIIFSEDRIIRVTYCNQNIVIEAKYDDWDFGELGYTYKNYITQKIERFKTIDEFKTFYYNNRKAIMASMKLYKLNEDFG
ncbi:MAG: hypothetical protein J6T10_06675 [Methanobrevibacter sp.]|nr:hypothetical protein [Methanobrevibacter sp.]